MIREIRLTLILLAMVGWSPLFLLYGLQGEWDVKLAKKPMCS